MIFTLIFWASVILLAHSYLLYPLLIQLLGRNKTLDYKKYNPDDDLPFVSIIMSVHNEENVIVDKIRSIFYTHYPHNKIELIIGSDASTDGTNRICKVYQKNYDNLRFYEFNRRQGKPSVINTLVKEVKSDLMIMTDAKVFFRQDTIFELVKFFKDGGIQIVGGNILNEKTRKDGISVQEKAFMNREIIIKYNESLIWGKTIGIYGAVYAIRKNQFTPIPEGYSVDDFFITLQVLSSGGKAIINLNAETIEEVPNLLKTEFRRKVRISVGNFQNLGHFARCLWPPWSSLSFAFLSHKVIRWLGPVFILLTLISNLFIFDQNWFYQATLIFLVLLMFLVLCDLFLRKINIHIVILRFITHFFAMNVALLFGLIKYTVGIKSNIWQPTRR